MNYELRTMNYEQRLSAVASGEGGNHEPRTTPVRRSPGEGGNNELRTTPVRRSPGKGGNYELRTMNYACPP